MLYLPVCPSAPIQVPTHCPSSKVTVQVAPKVVAAVQGDLKVPNQCFEDLKAFFCCLEVSNSFQLASRLPELREEEVEAFLC
ncbi:hypothetical protein MA16_Dca009939 [Dendrobium catenatum]|uniref:Uncharacterized protein n=1 Tax=Dendrobium catenatum TaxID=906689 RepID=A0A2I0WDB9_9ASPA|nr:hypothetical protein MA16_Dca009939 [Dendrobium catenatum]